MSETEAPTPDEEEEQSLLDEEAAADDDESGDEPGEAEASGDRDGEPEAQETQAMLEKRAKSFEALSRHVARRTTEILADDASMVDRCLLCDYYGMPGWLPSIPPPEDLRATLAAYIGQRSAFTLKQDRYSRACDFCAGEGFVKTDSKVPGQEALPCIDCKGMGWIAVGDERRAGLLSLRNGPAAPTVTAAPAESGMAPATQEEPSEVAALRKLGYVVVPPLAVQS